MKLAGGSLVGKDGAEMRMVFVLMLALSAGGGGAVSFSTGFSTGFQVDFRWISGGVQPGYQTLRGSLAGRL
jgi:hypothetical protein